ncbi:putative iron-regulated protein [Mucilaginibacter gracilis]|uniref:Putative iron-regulated protein n=1 Tax=Mucilaginibacter gracilis TaxID=423350 RepID=A0A495J275_9SPHI|nr:ChaN family lipoprotein [Mucilaginibacter gracilis]RKR83047.1 putative iron-regulated protein [Mucilaginibacter gracilis]
MKNILAVSLLFSTFLAFGQQKMADHYKIYNTATGKTVTIDDIVADMASANVLFFGEEHNDTTAHYMELTILKTLIAKYPARVALSMEMFETDTQPVVNEYLKGLIREKNFITDARAWPNYKDYRPLVELAKASNINLIAANAPARYTNMVTRMGLSGLDKLDATGKSHLPPLPIDTAAGKYYQKFETIMGGHSSMPGMQIYQSQNLWDATMAWSIAQYLKVHPGIKIFQMNGGFHSEEKLGAVAQLKKYSPGLRVLNIASLSGTDINQPDWSKYTNLADYIILTDFKAAN